MAEFINAKRLPSKGKPGNVYWVNNAALGTHDIWFATGDGTLINLSDLLQAAPAVRAVGPQGEQGRQGEAGPQGPAGSKARDGAPGPIGPVGPHGTNGISITGKTGAQGERGLTGPAGPQGVQGIPGPVGPQGPAGDVLYIGPDELQAAVKAARAEIINQRGRFLAVIAQALHDNKSSGAENYRKRIEHMLAQLRSEAGL